MIWVCTLQAEDADKAAERAQTAQGQRAEALSRLQDVHRQKARHLKDSVEAVQQVKRRKPACICGARFSWDEIGECPSVWHFGQRLQALQAQKHSDATVS